MKVTTNIEGKISSLLDTAYNLFQEGDFLKSIEVLEEALSLEFDHAEVVFALKCANFWDDKKKKWESKERNKESGEYFIIQWKNFILFLDRIENDFESTTYPIRQWVFKNALSELKETDNGKVHHEGRYYFLLGRCYKGIGNYENALEYFETANHQKADDPEILAELADCYALIGEVKAAKVFFREAFFLNPQKVDIHFLESMLILRLISKVKASGYLSPELEEWIPIYGTVFGVLNVKRELKPLEHVRLKQEVLSMESELSRETEKSPFFVPRLLNRYFWLIDHYVSSKEDKIKIEEIFEKIRKIDPNLYDLYVH